MLAIERKYKLIHYVREHRVATVAQLAKEFQVHEATIRRDLAEIEQEGILKRTHGGVMINERVSSEPSFSERQNKEFTYKQAIGEKAAQLVENGDQIILDSGTTTLHIAKALLNHTQLTVVTNDIKIAAELSAARGIKIILTGGILYPDNYMLNGVLTNQALKSLHVNKAFIGTPAVHPVYGLTHFEDQLIAAKMGMITAAQEVIVVADHTKIGKASLHTVAPIGELHKLITNSGISIELVQAFEDAGIEMIFA